MNEMSYMPFRNYTTDLIWSDFQDMLLSEESKVQKSVNYVTFVQGRRGNKRT